MLFLCRVLRLILVTEVILKNSISCQYHNEVLSRRYQGILELQFSLVNLYPNLEDYIMTQKEHVYYNMHAPCMSFILMKNDDDISHITQGLLKLHKGMCTF